MKKYVLFLFCCLSVFGQAAAQESRSLSLSATIEFGNLEYSSSSLMGAGSFDSSSFTGIGIHVTQPIYEHWDIVTGISYGWASGDFSNPSNRGPGISDPIRQTYKFFTLPVLARFHFWKYFFIDGGVYCDAKVSEKNELLFGFGGGIGAEYTFSSGLKLSVRPAVQSAFLLSDYNMHQYGIAVGIGYKF